MSNIQMRSYKPAVYATQAGVQNSRSGLPSMAASRIEAENWKNSGNEFRKHRMYGQAMDAYESAIRTDPTYTDAYYNLAQLMERLGNIPRGIQLLTQLLYLDPDDHDSRVLLGEYFERSGNTQEAKKRYMEVLGVKPDFDPAKRRLNYLLYADQRRFYPDTAKALLQTRYREVIHSARELLGQYFRIHHPNPVLEKLSQTVPVVFEETRRQDEFASIAEFDAERGVIRVEPQLLFSSSNVIAAYLAHELIHVMDGDSRTSIQEEQKAYQELVRFWGIYQGADNDPSLDRALTLYQQSPDKLNQEVRRIYTIQDPSMPEKSPGHGMHSDSPATRAAQAHDDRMAELNRQRIKHLLAYNGGVSA